MTFAREIHRLLIGLLIAFAIAALAAGYWAITGADTLDLRTDNPRGVLREMSIRRGTLLDRAGRALTENVIDANDAVTRRYPYPAMNSALGYASYQYGVAGAEAAFNAVLRGDDPPREPLAIIGGDLLHRARVGADVRLTFDVDVQARIVQTMGDRSGAAVVLSVPGGDVLSLVSLPTYDPNTLEATWETQTTGPGNPFFNRALQAGYQPGGTLQTVLLAGARLSDLPLDTPIDGAGAPLRVGDLALECTAPPPAAALTLSEAYQFGCPAAFADLSGSFGGERVGELLSAFRLDMPPTLEGWLTTLTPDGSIPLTPTALPTAARINSDFPDFVLEALGQGETTVVPLTMAAIAAAVIHDGRAPAPHAGLARRAPTGEWTPIDNTRAALPMMTAEAARAVQTAMLAAVTDGAAHRAARPNLAIGGHVALAYAGATSQAWFIGFVTLPNGGGAAVAVVLESSADLNGAAAIGGEALAAAAQALSAPQNE